MNEIKHQVIWDVGEIIKGTVMLLGILITAYLLIPKLNSMGRLIGNDGG